MALGLPEMVGCPTDQPMFAGDDDCWCDEASREWKIRYQLKIDLRKFADQLNQVIAQGGTTALEEPFTPEALAEAYLTGPNVICCFVAADRAAGRLEGFQTLGRYPTLPDEFGDIGTFARVGGVQRGVGSALFVATRAKAVRWGIAAINATIRADNSGGLAFYSRMGFADHTVQPGVPLKNGVLVDRLSKHHPLSSAG